MKNNFRACLLKVIRLLIPLGILFASYQSGAQSFSTVTPIAPVFSDKNTSEKPQSKVWKYNGKWWSAFPDLSDTYIWRLDGTSWTKALKISSKTSVKADCKVVGNVAHILLWRKAGNPTELISVEHVPATNNYKLWTNRPATSYLDLTIGTETATIDIDGNGRMWLASDGTTDVYVRWSDSPYTTWSTPITIATGLTTDDICSVIAMPVQGQIGVFWSNQNTKRFGFKTHQNGADPTTWSADEVPASQSALNVGNGMSDDHLNIKMASDGTLYCAVKTSYDLNGYPKISLLKRRPNGVWDNLYPVSEVGTRGIVILNESTGKLKVVYTLQELGGDILYNESPMSNISFGPTYTLISGINDNPSSSKASYDSDIVILAADHEKIVGVLATDGPASAPNTPSLLAPANLATGVATNTSLSWNATANTTSYHVQVSTLSNFSSTVFDQNNIATTSVQPTGLSNGTLYYWRVQSNNAVGSSAWSSPWSFTTLGLPAVPTLLSPADLATDVALNPTLSWNAAANATSYRAQVSTQSNFSSTVFDQSSLAGTSVQVNGLLNNTIYYWRVQSSNGTNNSAWSTSRSFTTIPPAAPAVPTLSSPADLAIDVALNPTLSWNAAANATSYQIQVSIVSNFTSTVLDQSNLVGTSVQVNTLSYNTVYYWRVRSSNGIDFSAYSSSRSFTTITAPQPPAVPTLLSPADLATDVALNPTLSWNAAANATSYHVQVSTQSDFSITVFDQSNLSSTSVQVNSLLNNTIYFWRVQSSNGTDNSAYSSSRSFTTITASSGNNLVGNWRMNEGSGSILVDDSGFGNNAQTIGGPTWSAGVAGSQLNLNGTSQYASVPDASSLDITQAITLAAWIRPQVMKSQRVLQKGTDVDGYVLNLLSTGKVSFEFNQISSSSYKLNSSALYPIGGTTWMHVAATYDGTTIRMYINGVQNKSLTVTPATINTNNLPLMIGAKNDGTSAFSGGLDDVRVYNYALSASEISDLYGNPEGGAAPSGGRIASGGNRAEPVQQVESDLSVSLFPNPAEDVLYLEFGNTSGTEMMISITDAVGRTYYKTIGIAKDQMSINLNDLGLRSGLYFLTTKSEKHFSITKLIKK